MKGVNFVVLAAGKGTRLKVSYSKILADLKGRKLIDFIAHSASNFAEDAKLKANIGFVLGHQKGEIRDHLGRLPGADNFSYAIQEEQLGTGHAVKTYLDQVPEAKNNPYTFILCGDTPCLEKTHFENLWQNLETDGLDGVAAVFEPEDPFGLGRIIEYEQGFEIKEQKDGTKEQLKIRKVNSGFYLVKTDYLVNKIQNIKKSASSGEFYLTDLFQKNEKVKPISFTDEENFHGVNTLVDLEMVERTLNKRNCEKLQLAGVRIIDSNNTYVDDGVEVGAETTIYPGVVLEGKTKIGKKVTIEAGCVIKNSVIADGALIKAHSYLDSSIVGSSTQVGPSAHLRPHSELEEGVKIGNFVEVKKSLLKKESKVSHLSYVGDAEIGERTNIGCGFITCNYDGKNKHKTIVGNDAFIGSDTQTIAPVRIGDGAYVGSGSTINKDVDDGDFAISRAKQTNIKNGAKRFAKK